MLKEVEELKAWIEVTAPHVYSMRHGLKLFTSAIRAVRGDERKLMATKGLKAYHEAQAAIRKK